MKKSTIKHSLLRQCTNYIQQRIDVSEKKMSDAQHSANNETKSSAGDKYETGRAMMQMERDNFAQQLSNSIFVKAQLDRIDPDQQFERAAFGSVVRTSAGNYFIAISAGRVMVEEERFFAISPQAPLAKEMIQKKAGDHIRFNEKDIRILEVF